jgi:hypothetical protein
MTPTEALAIIEAIGKRLVSEREKEAFRMAYRALRDDPSIACAPFSKPQKRTTQRSSSSRTVPAKHGWRGCTADARPRRQQ